MYNLRDQFYYCKKIYQRNEVIKLVLSLFSNPFNYILYHVEIYLIVQHYLLKEYIFVFLIFEQVYTMGSLRLINREAV